ncbi:hypothetical protein EYF80_008319 [Liparis tanakae]|uniref:Uncharacterized protein n=1 Tax=Liparis tanakae TaxID=230148 RepID=A0A4Z2IUY1_9TELE|nr:hypothetical protein EYF80_008319 [Liparis tanakae]
MQQLLTEDNDPRADGRLRGTGGPLRDFVVVCGGLYKARVAVFLHERVDFGLGQTETGQVGLHYVLLCDAFGHMVKIYLQRRLICLSGAESLQGSEYPGHVCTGQFESVAQQTGEQIHVWGPRRREAVNPVAQLHQLQQG